MNDSDDNQNAGSIDPAGVSIDPNTVVIDDSSTGEVGDASNDVVQEPVAETSTDSNEGTYIGRKPHKGFQTFSTDAAEKVESGETVVLPSHLDAEVQDILKSAPNVNILDNPQSRDWAQTLASGLELNTFNEGFVSTLQDENADFRQSQVHNNINLHAGPPQFKPIENQDLKGERAIIRLINHLGLGTLFSAPMWHSGFWITFKPPTESEIVELNRLMISDKIQFGRASYGLAFSNTVVYSTDRVVDFILNHVYDITTKSEEINVGNLKNHLSSQDIPSLIWGFICTMYPKGFKYRRACIADASKCNFILEETLNVSKLQWTNTKGLTDWQKTHMSSRQPKSKDLASINRYKEELNVIQKKRIVLNEGTHREISVTLKSPSVFEYVDSGHRWISDIVDTVNSTLAMDAGSDERNSLIIRHGQASALRQYVHWIDSIEMASNTITDRETIESTLNVLSQDDEIRDSLITKIVDYINSSTISVIGIPVFDCPECGKEQASSIQASQYKNIIPLDMLQLFFDLHTQRLARIATR